MAVSNEELEMVVKNLLNQNKEEQNQEWKKMVEDMVDAKLTDVEENWKKVHLEKKDIKINENSHEIEELSETEEFKLVAVSET